VTGEGIAANGPTMEGHDEHTGFWRWLRSGYDRRTVIALALMALTCGTVGIVYRHLIEWDEPMDWLLVGIWAVMGALLSWRVDPRKDLPLLLVGLVGGGVIEWWGTESVLWVYYTRERPPLWILPAWPISALAIVRIYTLLRRACPPAERLWPLYWLVIPGFVALMTKFLWVRIHVPASQVVVGLMVAVALVGAKPRRDLLLFISGAALGVFLEYWGTTRFCWTYYTREKPPIEAALAHGFATVAFARGVQGVFWVKRVLGTRRGAV
jgi:hypothetical protein